MFVTVPCWWTTTFVRGERSSYHLVPVWAVKLGLPSTATVCIASNDSCVPKLR